MEVDMERRVQIVLCSKLDNLLDVHRKAEAADAEISPVIKLSFSFNQKYLDRPLYHHARHRTGHARAQRHRTLSSGVICGHFVQQGWK